MALYNLDKDLDTLIALVNEQRKIVDQREEELAKFAKAASTYSVKSNIQKRQENLQRIRAALSGHFFFINGLRTSNPANSTLINLRDTIIAEGKRAIQI